jgi:hypothetical protein
MRTLTLFFACLAFACAVPSTSLAAASPDPLAAAIAARRGPVWLSYQVDAVPDFGFICCLESFDLKRRAWHDSQEGSCRPEQPGQGWSVWGDAKLASTGLRVLLKVQAGRVEQVRAYSPECRIEGLKAVETIAVEEHHSIELLTRLAESSRDEDELERIVGALALHRAPSAGRVLAEFAQPGRGEKLRHHAIFWLGQTRGDFALSELVKLVGTEKDRDLREHIVFSISQTETPDHRATAELIRLVRQTKDPELRRQALFWLGESKDPRALDLIAELLE